MMRDKSKNHVKITAEELSEIGENKHEAIKEAATLVADEAQKAIKDVRAKSKALQKDIIHDAKDQAHEIKKATDKVTREIKKTVK